MSEAVKLERRGAVLEVTLDRPKANAIDLATSRALHAAFRTLQDDPALRVAILTGGGERIFSAGWDLKAAASGAEEPDTDFGPGGFAGLTAFWELSKPVIAAVNGVAIAGGCELALAADLMVVADHAEFALSEVTVGLVADAGGIQRLPRRIPPAVAAELLLTGRRFTAAEAKAWGLANAVVPGAELMATARALAERIVAAAPLAVAAVKAILAETDGMSVREAYEHVAAGKVPAHRAMQLSEDSREGAKAFVERRAPVWKGR
ncbi:enoyl-CoA hydratase-related protein [Labrys wisconsinensis]|uniref:Crotonobetainyl-CoA hydratase n=1 Tax=Labrys wisconsinensis TaxID=425677 RepID=A0ABU0J106_9HYPH|nr:enoyl-CoA hydratase-related protein [Labrys wisconsinensis]MDQ0467310.1 crotonobetainyl-CoA hydratase [Labrys wisconsinensis]